MTKRVLATLAGMSLVFAGCVMDSGSNAESNGGKPNQKSARAKKTAGDIPLKFYYPVNINQESPNHRVVGILAPHVQVSGNLSPYIDQFQDALVEQIQTIFQKRGYQVMRFTSGQVLTPAQKHQMWSVLDIGGWVGILEDVKMDTKDPSKQDMDVMVDQSSGSVWFKFFEPETGRIIHNFGIEVGTEQAITHTYTYQATDSGGFAGANTISHTELEKNNDNAIRKILNQMYVIVMKRMVEELTSENIDRYRDAIEKIKNKGK
ncbi:HpaA family protein [Helicobacter bizzozeronii]|uniref:HpaA family protein n=1 Tax=Helicobacter bizzozeronii TaxID=56877 RepID=UPI000CEDAEF7